MSRSYKKTPCDWGSGRKKGGKNEASRRVRNHKGSISDGAEYRRLYDSWSIKTGSGYVSEQEYLRREFAWDCYWELRFGKARSNSYKTQDRWEKDFRRK